MTVPLRPSPLVLVAVTSDVLSRRACLSATVRTRRRAELGPHCSGETGREVRSGPSSAPAESNLAGRDWGIELEAAMSSRLVLGCEKHRGGWPIP
jgi:hypothetical protein